MSTYRPFIAAVRIAFLSCATLLLAACAGAPQVETAPPVEYVWPAPPEPAVIRYVATIRDLEVNKQKRRFRDILGGSVEEQSRTLNRPFDVATDSRGRIFVADPGLTNVVVYDANGRFLGEWGTAGTGDVRSPMSLAMDKNDNLYVCDTVKQRVVVFGPDGRVRNVFGGKDIFSYPVGIAINDDLGRVYVVDSRLAKIMVFNLDGELASTFEGPFSEDVSGFYFPLSITIDNRGNLWIVDSMNNRIVALDADGNYFRHWGEQGTNLGDLSRPKGIALDSSGNVYISDVSFSNVQIFDQEGNLLLFFGSQNVDNSGFLMPAGMHFDGRDRLYVADQLNGRVQVFEFLGSPEIPGE